jgi:hypothetical protein
MANEFKHKDPGTSITQCEYISSSGCGHIFACQATGDIIYADSSTVLKKLAKGTTSQVLQIASCKPAWTSTPTIGSTSWANANHAHAACNSGGAITFGAIDNGTSNITTGGTTTIDVDATGTDGACLSAAGTLRFGDGQDLRIYHGGTNNYITGITGDLIIGTQGSGTSIVLDAEDDSVEIKYSGTLGASFGTGGLNLVSGDVFSINCNTVLSATALASAVKVNNANWCGTDLSVANGGTGASTFTANGILVGNGTSAVAVTATMATKGHLMVGDGSGAPSMLAVGTNDHVLTAASGEATGVKWAIVAGATPAKVMAYSAASLGVEFF